MTREEQIAVCHAFNLGEPISCKPLGGTRNRNYLLVTDRLKYVVRDRYVGYRDPARVAFDHEAIEFLAKGGVPIAEALRTVDGGYVLEDGEHMWEVFFHIVGWQLRYREVRGLAESLALFHRRGRDFESPSNVSKIGPRGETDPDELNDLVTKLRHDAPQAVERYARWLRQAATDLSNAAYNALPHTLVHGDIQPANVLAAGSQITAFVDLDWCAWRPRIYDLAFAILLCCATHQTPIDGGDIWSLSQAPVVQADLTKTFLETYERQGWPLSPEEKVALRPQLTLSWCHVRLAGAMKVEPQRRAEFLDRPPRDLAALFPDGLT